MLQNLVESSINHVCRSCNEKEKGGWENKLHKTWQGVPPRYIVNLLASECAN